MKPRVVLVHPPFGPYGGGELVAAWVLQALADDHALTLFCLEPVNWSRVDERFGTRLAHAGVVVRTPPAHWRRVLQWRPDKADRLRRALYERLAARLATSERTVWISTYNEMRLPRPGIQYVHFPTPGMLPDAELRPMSGPPQAQRLYQEACRQIAGAGLAEHREHVTLVNSRFTAGVWRETHGTEAHVVYPPVPPLAYGGESWDRRADRAVCLGRLFPGKNLERVVAIVAAARERGVTMKLAIAGKWDCPPAERAALEGFLRSHPWVELHENISRAALAELAGSSRYGLHGMVHEPFGIAVAELQEAGAITFAPASGGPPEIVGDERLLYRDVEDGAEKLARVWRDPALQHELRQGALVRADRFSPPHFVAHLRAHVAAVLAGRPGDVTAAV